MQYQDFLKQYKSFVVDMNVDDAMARFDIKYSNLDRKYLLRFHPTFMRPSAVDKGFIEWLCLAAFYDNLSYLFHAEVCVRVIFFPSISILSPFPTCPFAA